MERPNLMLRQQQIVRRNVVEDIKASTEIFLSSSKDDLHRKAGDSREWVSRLLTPKETARLLGVSVATLAVWRCTKRYQLSHVNIGRLIRYRVEDVIAAQENGLA